MAGVQRSGIDRCVMRVLKGIEMDKEEQQEELQEAFAAFAAEYPQSALALITGLFVGLLEYSVKEQGGDETLAIKIDGCGKRDITVSAMPHNV